GQREADFIAAKSVVGKTEDFAEDELRRAWLIGPDFVRQGLSGTGLVRRREFFRSARFRDELCHKCPPDPMLMNALGRCKPQYCSANIKGCGKLADCPGHTDSPGRGQHCSLAGRAQPNPRQTADAASENLRPENPAILAMPAPVPAMFPPKLETWKLLRCP